MKKLWAIVLLLGSLACAQAQLTLSADVWTTVQGRSFSKQNLAAVSPDYPNVTHFVVSPRMGFDLGQRMQLGIAIGYAYDAQSSLDGFYDSTNGQWQVTDSLSSLTHSFSAGLYLRCRVGSFGHFTFHLEPQLTYSMGLGVERAKRQYANYNDMWMTHARNVEQQVLSVGVVPVLEYTFDQHLSLDLVMDFAALRYQHSQTSRSGLYTVSNYSKPNPRPDESVTEDSFDIGLHFRSTQLLSIGLNYHF